MKFTVQLFILLFLLSFFSLPRSLHSQETSLNKISYNKKTYHIYPEVLDKLPDIPSPFTTKDSIEVIIAFTKNKKYALIPVTVENGDPLLYSKRIKSLFGKDRQLQVDSGDFPDLAETGLHYESKLDKKDMITGVPVSVITYIGRPGRFSRSGFLADDEDIISVLKGDNNLVKKLALTHPQMARPLFHIWNIILKEIELGYWARFWKNIQYIIYNGRNIFLEASGSKGWQVSIFQDEIQGRFNLHVHRELSPEEQSFLKARYSHLSAQQMIELEEGLCSIDFSEMAPYYIMRYGFYEGHTAYRTDPIAIAFIFGIRSLEEIDTAFKGELYRILTEHIVETTK